MKLISLHLILFKEKFLKSSHLANVFRLPIVKVFLMVPCAQLNLMILKFLRTCVRIVSPMLLVLQLTFNNVPINY